MAVDDDAVVLTVDVVEGGGRGVGAARRTAKSWNTSPEKKSIFLVET